MAEKIVKDSQGLAKDLVNDCISRQAAIDALDEIRHALWEIDIPSPTVPEYIEHHEQVQSVWKLLDKKQKELYAMPSAQPEQRWIPCSERLPFAEFGESDNVLTTCGYRDVKDTSVRWIRLLYFNGGNWCYPTGGTYEQKVYAWMPLPKGYKGE